MKLFLIGMPGAGKSTIGRQLSEILKIDFIDLDEEITKREQRSIAEIFRDSGEEHFRSMEASVLRDVISKNDSFVMATGGGTPCFHNSMSIINNSGKSIYLKTSLEVLVNRVSQQSGRPLLDNETNMEDKMRNLLRQREPVYEKAHLMIEHASAADILATLTIKM